MKTVLIVDDDPSIREVTALALSYDGKYQVLAAATGAEGLTLAERRHPDVMLLDVKMPGMDGFEVMERMRQSELTVPVIVISAHGDITTAVNAMRLGAYDFMEKPFTMNRLQVTIANCISHHEVIADKRVMQDQGSRRNVIVGDSKAMHGVRAFIDKVAASDATVLITGENGTGKELVVNAIHRASARRERPLVEVNCAAIPRDLVESELFGHERGSFTGADRQRTGRFEQANGGTLFLDEIGDMGEEAQAKVLKAVEESRFQRVGGTETRSVDVRIIAATNRELSSPQSGFRQDLFYRLNVLSLHLPPLREREGDVALLLDWFMADLAARLKVRPRRFAPDTVAILREYSWPGNVRELRNLVERLLILAPEDVIRPIDLPPLPGAAHARPEDASLFAAKDFQEFKTQSETVFLQLKLKENLYNVSRTADVLGMQRSNLYKKITKYGLRTQPGEEPGRN